MDNQKMEEHERDRLEKLLNGMRSEHEQTPVPDRLGSSVAHGIARARAGRRRIRQRIWSAAACFALIAVFVTTVRVSTAFAALVAQIPGFDAIVKMIQHDQGLRLAAQGELMQPVDISDEHDGIKVTVDGVIMDEARMNVFYTIEQQDENREEFLGKHSQVTFEGEDQHLLKFGSYEQSQTDPDNPGIERGKIDLEFYEQKDVLPNKAVFHLKVPGYEREWTIPFMIDTSKFIGLKETIAINQTVTVEDQSFTFTEAVVYPTRILLKAKFDLNNTKHIFGFRDLRIVNERGDPLTSNMATGPDENGEVILYYESNYLAMPKELYIEGSKLSALERDKTEVTIDLEKGEFTMRPDDRIRLDNVVRDKDFITLYYSMHGLDESDNHSYSIDKPFRDAAGQTYDSSGGSEYSRTGMEQKGRLQIPNLHYQGPITFKLYNYPSFIQQPFRVQIK